MHLITSFVLLFAAIDGALSQALANPGSIPKSTRDQWCLSQKTQCPYICTQLPGTDGSPATQSNTCSSDTLAYTCVCSNGASPNASEYSQTIPYFICTENNNQCVDACNGLNTCQDECRAKNPCGAQDPKRVNTSTITTMTATGTNGASASGTGVFTGFGSGAASTTGAKSGGGTGAATRTIINIGQVYGLAVVVIGFFAGFAIVL